MSLRKRTKTLRSLTCPTKEVLTRLYGGFWSWVTFRRSAQPATERATGDRFMSLCKNGQIQNCCHPNALMTLEEYLMDYASEETKEIGERLIEKELLMIPNEKVRKIATEHIADIANNNKRDFRF